MTSEELIAVGKAVVDYYLDQTAESVTIKQETREVGAQTGLSDALYRQVVEMYLKHPEQSAEWLGAQCDRSVSRWTVMDILKGGKYVAVGKLTPRVERARKRLIALGLMSKNPVSERS